MASAYFPDGYFSHVFIDEAGHAQEPEAVIAVSGKKSSLFNFRFNDIKHLFVNGTATWNSNQVTGFHHIRVWAILQGLKHLLDLDLLQDFYMQCLLCEEEEDYIE